MNIALSLGLSLVIAPALLAEGDKPKGKVVHTTLTKIRKSPNAFKNVWVRFPIQFVSLGKIENPFFTQFVPQRFANFYCWADEQQIWKRDQFEDVFGLMFVSKENKKIQKIYKLKVYQRLSVIAIVRNTFQGEPWIEVKSFIQHNGAVTTSTLSHLYRGETYMKKRQWNKAVAELSLAPSSDLPDHVMGQVHKDLALCYLRLGESGTAISHLENAVGLMKTIDNETRQMADLARVKPETFLDRVVSVQVEDHERPMWEAFSDEDEADGLGEMTPAAPTKR